MDYNFFNIENTPNTPVESDTNEKGIDLLDTEEVNLNEAGILEIFGVYFLMLMGTLFSLIIVDKIQNSELYKALAHAAEDSFRSIWYSVKVHNNMITIKGIDPDMLLSRLKETYNERSLANIFEKRFTFFSEIFYKLRIIKKEKNKTIHSFTCPLFFALELSKIFYALYEKFGFQYYKSISADLYKLTWVSTAKDVTYKELDTKNLSNFNFELKDFQLKFIMDYPRLKNMLRLNGYILSFDQGLGKTFTAIALAECLDKDVIYIICPNSLKKNWANEIKKFYKKYKDEKLFSQEVCIVGDVKNFDKSKVKIFITNQENITILSPYALPSKDTMLIVDESHNFRNYSGIRTKELIAFKNKLAPKDILCMSGTPIKAVPSEIVPSLMLIDPTFTEECAEIYTKVFSVDDTLIKDIVKERFGHIIHRKLKSQVLELPAKRQLTLTYEVKNYEEYLIDSAKLEIFQHYEGIYNEALANNEALRSRFISYIQKYSSASFVDNTRYLMWVNKLNVKKIDYQAYHDLTISFIETFNDKYIIPNIKDKEELKDFKNAAITFIKMHQSCMAKAIGAILPKKRTKMFQELFLENKEDIINRIQGHPKKTVIFTIMLDVAKLISSELTKSGVTNVLITGEVPNKIRQNLLEQFREDDGTQVLVATSQTLSTGVTLVEASQMFFFGTPWRSSDYEQACDRIYRIGQTSDVSIYTVLLSSQQANLSSRMQEILQWSGDMFSSYIDSTVDFKDIYKEENHDILVDFILPKLINEQVKRNLKDPQYMLLKENSTDLNKRTYGSFGLFLKEAPSTPSDSGGGDKEDKSSNVEDPNDAAKIVDDELDKNKKEEPEDKDKDKEEDKPEEDSEKKEDDLSFDDPAEGDEGKDEETSTDDSASTTETSPDDKDQRLNKLKKSKIADNYKQILSHAGLLNKALEGLNKEGFSPKEVEVLNNFSRYLTTVASNCEDILERKLRKYSYQKLLILFIQNKTILDLVRDSTKNIIDKK